jgi:alpha-ribazole phosphatase
MGVILLRHTTPKVEHGVCYGMTDLALAESFEAEAAEIVRQATRPVRIVTSPLGRCRRLADRMGAVFGLEPQVDPRWREMDFGTWEGVDWSAIPRHELDGWAAAFHDYNGHGGESVAQLEARVRAALTSLPEGALVVTHAGCIKAACAIRGQPPGWEARPRFGEAVQLAD